MTMTTSGAIGSVNKGNTVISSVTNWSLNTPVATSSSVATSNSKGGVITTTGPKDSSGSFTTKGITPVLYPGEKFDFSGYCGPSDGVLANSGTGTIYSVPSIVGSMTFSWDFNSADALGWSYSFSGNGEVTESSGVIEDNSVPDIETIQGATLSPSGLTTTAGSITISSAISGGTATSNSQGWKLRWAGPISGTAQLTCILSTIETIGVSIDDDVELVITTSSGKVITFKWWKITGTGAITVDNNTGEPQPFTLDGAFSAHDGNEYGQISVDGTILFPVPQSN